MKVLSLFSGIGGLDLAAEWAGMETVAFCEIDDYACKVLGKRWPNVPIYRDVRELSGERLQQDGIKVDLITGGFPCQPHSLAGKRLAQADKRDLWGECSRLLCEVRPRWAVFENVPGLLSSDSGRFFRRILWDISQAGHDALWASYGTSNVGGCHYRERTFIVSYAKGRRFAINFAGRSKTRRFSGNHWWNSEPDVGRVAKRIPLRMDRLRCLGNAVVPQQAYPIFKAIMEVDSC